MSRMTRAEVMGLLGTMPDSSVAYLAGWETTQVRGLRRRSGIAACPWTDATMDVDWPTELAKGESNTAIAARLGCHPRTVARRRNGAPSPGRPGRPPLADWAAVDWAVERPKDVAARLGVRLATVYMARRRYMARR